MVMGERAHGSRCGVASIDLDDMVCDFFSARYSAPMTPCGTKLCSTSVPDRPLSSLLTSSVDEEPGRAMQTVASDPDDSDGLRIGSLKEPNVQRADSRRDWAFGPIPSRPVYLHPWQAGWLTSAEIPLGRLEDPSLLGLRV